MVLVILDGYGHREERQDNAILNAGTPVMDRLWREQPHTLIAASGLDVGLPDGQMGNPKSATSIWAPGASCTRI